MRLLIIGPFPTPIGGVSIHLQRLKQLMEPEIDVYAVDESPVKKEGMPNIRFLNIISYFSLLRRADVLHVHSSVPIFRFMHIILGVYVFQKRVILTLHSFRNNKVKNWEQWLYRKCWKIIVVNEAYKQFIENSNILYMPAFIPPLDVDFTEDLPLSLRKWLDLNRCVGNRILVSNAFRLDFHNGVDIYGLDMALALMERLVLSNENVVLVFIVASLEKGKDVYDKYMKQIELKGLEENIKLMGEAVNFPALIAESDLVLRLTCTDGDALTVRESMWLNKRVLASDVVPRPEGCSLFKNRDASDLYRKVKIILSEDNKEKNNEKFNYKNWYLNLYKA